MRQGLQAMHTIGLLKESILFSSTDSGCTIVPEVPISQQKQLFAGNVTPHTMPSHTFTRYNMPFQTVTGLAPAPKSWHMDPNVLVHASHTLGAQLKGPTAAHRIGLFPLRILDPDMAAVLSIDTYER